ncbi:MAG: DUF6064 family protein [Balneolaceae bacterium]|nr:DUF6064 family protein [Balneolaceae bacterium]
MGNLPFTTEQFLQVFESYNGAIWPAQWLGYLLGIAAVYLAVAGKPNADKYLNRMLAFFWIWMGVVYHMLFFAGINSAAWLFGALFVVQGVAFLLINRTDIKLHYGYRNDLYGITGGVLILYAMVLYPLLGHLLGHTYPRSPVFGVAPCPTAIFTFGLLLWTRSRVPYWLLAIPFLWALVGFSAAFSLTIYEDTGLVVAGLTAVILLVRRNRAIKSRAAVRESVI